MRTEAEENQPENNNSTTAKNTGSKSSGISLYSMVKAMAGAMDLISETVVGHHKKTAYISLRLGKAMNLPSCQLKMLIIAALMHDLGVFYLDQSYSDLSFDKPHNKHAEVGYRLARGHFPDESIPEAIKYHHADWDSGSQKNDIPQLSNFIHLADRIAVFIDNNQQEYLWPERDRIKKVFSNLSGERFFPPAVEAFNGEIADTEYFWLDVQSPRTIEDRLDHFCQAERWYLTLDELDSLGRLLSYITDYRSSFTATHSRGIASSSQLLGQKFDLPPAKRRLLKVAGSMHDIGKLIVPTDILNKPGDLTEEEWNIMKTHTYYTYQSLGAIEELPELKNWAAFHHERLDGQGYPFRIAANELPLESRIIAAADVFTALTEERPYREGMPEDRVKKILSEMVAENELDEKVTGKIIDNYQEFSRQNQHKQQRARQKYQDFRKKVEEFV